MPNKIVYMNNILDIKPNLTTALIGTLYKEMPKKPCILTSLVGVLRDKNAVNYCTKDDYMVLEDSSGRIRIKNSSTYTDINPSNFITGSIIGFKGQVD